MKKKMARIGNSYGVVLPPTLLDLMGADLKNLNKTYFDLDYDSNTKTILIKNPVVVEDKE